MPKHSNTKLSPDALKFTLDVIYYQISLIVTEYFNITPNLFTACKHIKVTKNIKRAPAPELRSKAQ